MTLSNENVRVPQTWIHEGHVLARLGIRVPIIFYSNPTWPGNVLEFFLTCHTRVQACSNKHSLLFDPVLAAWRICSAKTPSTKVYCVARTSALFLNTFILRVFNVKLDAEAYILMIDFTVFITFQEASIGINRITSVLAQALMFNYISNADTRVITTRPLTWNLRTRVLIMMKTMLVMINQREKVLRNRYVFNTIIVSQHTNSSADRLWPRSTTSW